MLEKFKDNFFSLNKILNENDLLDFLVEKEAFNEIFIELVCESDELTKLSNVRKHNTKNFEKQKYFFDISKIKIDYNIGYDKNKNKITVDISGNRIFSYYDDKKELKRKLDCYIDKEEYEKASVIYNFMKKCNVE